MAPEITPRHRPKVLLQCESVRTRDSVVGGTEHLVIGPWMGAATPRWVHESSLTPLDDLREVLAGALEQRKSILRVATDIEASPVIRCCTTYEDRGHREHWLWCVVSQLRERARLQPAPEQIAALLSQLGEAG
jgi:hypothetical protein